MMSAIAMKLGELFPDRLAYYQQVKQMADGQHYIRCIDQTHTRELDRRRRRSYSFEVLYFRRDDDALEFNAWAEIMYMEFETLTVGERVFHVTDAHARPGDDMVFHFVFDVKFIALLESVPGNPMEQLDIETEVIP